MTNSQLKSEIGLFLSNRDYYKYNSNCFKNLCQIRYSTKISVYEKKQNNRLSNEQNIRFCKISVLHGFCREQPQLKRRIEVRFEFYSFYKQPE